MCVFISLLCDVIEANTRKYWTELYCSVMHWPFYEKNNAIKKKHKFNTNSFLNLWDVLRVLILLCVLHENIIL